MTSKQEQCMYCHENTDDGYLYEDDISTITKHLYGKPQQVKWVGKNLSNYEADYDYYDEPVCKTHCYQDCKIVCTSEEKYFLVVDGRWTTYIPINCCPICRRNFNENENRKEDKEND